MEDISFSVFSIVPKNKELSEIIVIKDKPAQGQTPEEVGKTLPGGRKEVKDKSFWDTASREVQEETGQKINEAGDDELGEKLVLEVHKRDRDQKGAHHDLYVFCGVPEVILEKLELGEEVMEVRWEKIEEVQKEIAHGEFYHNHASAIRWLVARDEFLENGDISLIKPILTAKIPSRLATNKDKKSIEDYIPNWYTDGKTLVLCFHPFCKVCAKSDEEEDEEIKELYGKIKLVIFYSDFLESSVFLESSKEEQFNLPVLLLETPVLVEKPEEIEKLLKNLYQAEIEFLGILKNRLLEEIEEKEVLVCRAKQKTISGLAPVSLNKTPELIEIDREEQAQIWNAGPIFNKHTKGEKVNIYHAWKPHAPRHFARDKNKNP